MSESEWSGSRYLATWMPDSAREQERARVAVDAARAYLSRELSERGLGEGSLRERFADTFGALGCDEAGIGALFDDFVGSDELKLAPKVGSRVPGVSVTEAFARWLMHHEESDLVHRTAQREFCDAITRLLAICPDPMFLVDSPLVRCTERGAVAVCDEDAVVDGPGHSWSTPRMYVGGPLGRVSAQCPAPLASQILWGDPAVADRVVEQLAGAR